MSKRAHFDRLAAAANRTWPVREARLLLITGQSRLTRSPLTCVQADLLDTLNRPGLDVVRAGFPFDGPGEVAPGPFLPAASVANARQNVWARRDGLYARLVAAVLWPIAAATERVLVVVTGSTGLDMLRCAWPLTPGRGGLQLEIVSLGPVGAAPPLGPGSRYSAVQGRSDWWSRALYRGPVTHRPDCGHMGYWTDPATRGVLEGAVARALAPA